MLYNGNFEGATTALITPMMHGRRIDFESLKKNIEYQARYIDYLLSCGTTGQSPTLNWQEHQEITGTMKEIADRYGKLIIVGCGSNSTSEAVNATIEAYDQGNKAALHVTGYYNFPSQAGILRHFEEIANAVPQIRIIAYDVPGRGHPPIHPVTRIKMATDLGVT